MQNIGVNNSRTKQTLLFCLAAMTCCWMSFSSCSKTSAGGSGIPNKPSQPLQLPHGEVLGEMVSASIGAAGGILTSKDGAVTIDIPAGAVTAATTFSVQEVTNVLKGKARSYRLLPGSVNFLKPVKLVYNYGGQVFDGANPDLFFLAYQDKDGYFYSANKTKGDRQRQTLTVSTKHFSDWTFYNQYDLVFPSHSLANGELRLVQGEEATIQLRAIPIEDYNKDDSKMVLPDLSGNLLVQKAIWDYSPKKGTLLTTTPGTALYKAPAHVDKAERTFINVTINGNLGTDNLGNPVQQIQIRQPVVILPDSYFTLTEDGLDIAATSFSGEYTPALGSQLTAQFANGYELTCYVDGGVGSFAYDMAFMPGKANMQLTINAGQAMLVYRPDNCDVSGELFFSPGAFAVKSVARRQGEYFEGEFTVTLFGFEYCETGRKKSLSGKFRFRKVD